MFILKAFCSIKEKSKCCFMILLHLNTCLKIVFKVIAAAMLNQEYKQCALQK